MENQTYYMNAIYSQIILPNSIFLIIGTIIGVIGNLLILFLYTFGLKDAGGERYFIPILAFMDTLGCTISAVYYLLDNYFLFDFPSAELCQTLSLVVCFTSGSSGHLLLVIAAQRYLLICRPLGRQMTTSVRRWTVLVLFGVTFVYSLPLFMTSGIRLSKKSFLNQTVNARTCVLSVKGGAETMAYFVILFLITISNIVGISAFYIPVTKTIYQHMKKRNQRRQSVFNFNSVQTRQSVDASTMKSTTSGGSRQSSITDSEPAPLAKTRINLMFLAIIVVFIVSYLPSFAILLVTYIERQFDYLELSPLGINTWIFMARLIFLTHIVNPFVYGYFDGKLKLEMKRIFCRK